MTKINDNLIGASNRKLSDDLLTLHKERLSSSSAQDLNITNQEDAAKAFESFFVFYLLQTMRKSTAESGLLGKGFGNDFFTQLFDEQISNKLSETKGIGIAKLLDQQISKKDNISNSETLNLKSNKVESEEVSLKKVLPGSVLSSGYGLRNDPITGKERFHNGIDLACSEGKTIQPLMPGKVIFSGWKGNYGNLVIVKHEGGVETYYGHNMQNLVKEGDVVTSLTSIALSGKTGRTTGPHLHFEVRVNDIPQNPNKYVKNYE
ncbi:MAG: peptidoglycan DD-metalloendopeptidase family protein [Candidatus Schekmanbacteria bacterium]|nr:peptidoglycan DD-metalloendopeptidase family protein [Candidatus Schekmanbacteria bacterium]